MKYLQTTDTGQGEVRSEKATTLELTVILPSFDVLYHPTCRDQYNPSPKSQSPLSRDYSFLSKDINEKIRKLYCSEKLRVSIKENQQKIVPYSHKGGPQLRVVKTRDMSMSPADISNKLPANFWSKIFTT